MDGCRHLCLLRPEVPSHGRSVLWETGPSTSLRSAALEWMQTSTSIFHMQSMVLPISPEPLKSHVHESHHNMLMWKCLNLRGSATSPLKFHCKQPVLEGVVGICVVASLKQVKQCSDANKVCRYAKKLLRVFNTTAVGGPKNSGKQMFKEKKKKQQQKKSW